MIDVVHILVQVRKELGQLLGWLDKATEFATARKFDVDSLLSARLYPDMFPLGRQIMAAADAAKLLAARASGKAAPVHPDTETTVAGLRARITSVLDYLAGFTAEDFAGVDERIVPLAFLPGKGARAVDYVEQHAVPNFYFHLVMTYALLRHNGVELGKRDYIGGYPLVDLPA